MSSTLTAARRTDGTDETSGSLVPPVLPCTSVADFGVDARPTPHELAEFWAAMEPWLASHGVNLYARRGECWCPPLVSADAPLPFARRISERASSDTFLKPTRFACGQDLSGRDVMLKLVDKDSEQYHIFEILLAQRHLFTDSTTFPCVLPPEHIFDTPHQYSVVSMPTWGCPLYQGDMQSIQEILRFMQCVLQGLTFLHSNRIAHRDIFDFNIVVNCYRPDFKPESLRSNLRHHRATEDVFYALMDYDQSIQLPLDVSLKSCRRPADEGCYGSGLYKPTDLSLGQPTYNPFAFDVGMLGNFFRSNFPDVVSAVPALAALYDKMTTHLLAKRFTAEEALQFLDHQINGLPEEVLTRTLTTTRSWDALDDSEVYWSQLSPEQLEEWSHFRTPPIPMWSNVLAWFIGLPICCEIIVFSRCVLRL